MIKFVEFVKKNGFYVLVNGEDVFRVDKEFLVEFINEVKKVGVNRFRYCDIVGIMELFKLRDDIKYFYDKIGFDIEMYIYNDFGMVIVNVVVGIKGGVLYVGVIVNGFGERVGNVVLEEVVMVLMFVYGYKGENINI